MYTTSAETAYVDTYNDIYGTYPTYSDMGVRVNGVDLTALEPGKVGSVGFTVALGAGAKTVEFINGLQSGSTPAGRTGSYVCGVSFSDAATKVTPTATPRIIIYGDSIAVGANCANPSLEGWAQLVRNAYSGSVLIEARGYRNLFEDCETNAKRVTFVSQLQAQNPSIIWLAIGVNDYQLEKWSSSDFGTAYADLLDKINAAMPSVTVYAQTPLVKASEAEVHVGWGTLGAYRTAIATAQSTRSSYCTLVDGSTILEVGDLADGVHPTTAGHDKYADAVIAVLGI